MPQSLSIQSFYAPLPSSKTSSSAPASEAVTGEGFSSDEISAVLDPSSVGDKTWMPPENKEYTDVSIDDLQPGPGAVTFQGRIVNLYQQSVSSKRPQGAKGCNKFIVQDDSGCVTVRLWYAHQDYSLRLGQLATIWVVHVSNGTQGNYSSTAAPLFVSIFPERDRTCHFMTHENSDDGVICTTPLGYHEGEALPGLMTVRSFIDGGYELSDRKILVCVKSIGAKKKVTNKKGQTSDLVNVNVFDDTAEASLTLWELPTASASYWKPSQTVLLITNPGWRFDRKAWISLTSETLVNVDPCMSDATWLKRFAQNLTSKTHVNPPLTEGLDFDASRKSMHQILFTLADVDQFARAIPEGESYYGYLSLVVMDLNLSTLHRRQMLMCEECCGVPLFANALIAKCKQCDQNVSLRVNPRVISSLTDETGSLQAGAMLLTAEAWSQFFGVSPEALCRSAWEQVRQIEQENLFTRKTFWFGLKSEDRNGGRDRICVAEIVPN